MAVTSALTSLEDFETSPSYNDIGSGGGASDDTNAPIEALQAGGRRIDNATDKGFMATIASTDLSGAGEHVKMWLNVFQFGQVTALHVRIRSGTNLYDNHDYVVADLPPTFGYVPIWVDVSRTPDSVGSSGGLDESAVLDIGFYLTINNVFGAGNNALLDEIHNGTSGLVWSGASGDFGDFRTYEGINVEGVLVTLFQSDLCFARLELSDTASTSFTDSGFTIVFPDQVLVSTTFMGVTVDTTHADTLVALSNGALVSGNPTAATNRFDILAIGTLNGGFDMDVMLINGARTVELNEQCSMTDSTVLNSGLVDLSSAGTGGLADASGTTIADSLVAADTSSCRVNAAPSTNLDGMSFTRGAAAHHAIEFDTNVTASFTLTGVSVSGFNASDAQDDSVMHFLATSGSLTVTISGGSGTFSFKTEGIAITVNSDTTVTFDKMKDNTEVRVFKTSDDSVVAGIENATAGTTDDRNFAWAAPAATDVYYRIINKTHEFIEVQGFVIPADDTTVDIAQRLDLDFNDPP